MNIVTHFASYDYNEEWYLVEMLLDLAASDIDWDDICVPEAGIPERNWQAPYMEQYLNEDGTEKLCETYDIPDGDVSPCRVAFFVFKTSADTLRTPYGDFALQPTEPLPERLNRIVEFDDVDCPEGQKGSTAKKKLLLAVCILLALILLFPVPQRLKDGGSVEYNAILYSVTNVHRLNPDLTSEQEFITGITVEILGVEIFNNAD